MAALCPFPRLQSAIVMGAVAPVPAQYQMCLSDETSKARDTLPTKPIGKQGEATIAE